MVCGEICRRLRVGRDSNFATLLDLTEPVNGAQRSILGIVDELMEQSRRELDAGMQFALLLPGEDEPTAERAESLADWARGFALALLRDGELKLESLGGDSAEVVQDLLKISEAEPGEDPEEDERALVELEEYIRVGVQLMFEELQPDAHEESDKGIH